MENKIPLIKRCHWCEKDDLYRQYHDNEWGEVSHDDQYLFEQLILESFQAGLSWYTVLQKRENFKAAFDGFDPHKMANYTDQKIAELCSDKSIIRHKAKINAAINNAQCFLAIKKEFPSFDDYIWQFTKGKTIVNSIQSNKDVIVRSDESDAMSRDLKKRGFKFIGSTTCYAYMQAVGMVNDHFDYCWKK